MQRNLIITKDGSHTIELAAPFITYHSINGAIQESQHVFIDAGLKPLSGTKETICVFEMGFGTGLNALLTLVQAELHQQKIYYETIEAFPLEEDIITQLNYCEQLQQPDLKNIFIQLHAAAWEKEIPITAFFVLRKTRTSLINHSSSQLFNLIYYDAFAPAVQPELWTPEIFQQLFNMMSPGGILVTYSSKGSVRRAMQAAGFIVEKLTGAAGKREMIRAVKT